MNVFGLEPLVAAFLFTIIGVAGSVLLGWLKGTGAFNVRQAVASSIIAFVLSFQLVAATIQALPDGIDDLALGMIIMAMIGTVAGIDSLTKSGVKAALKTKPKGP